MGGGSHKFSSFCHGGTAEKVLSIDVKKKIPQNFVDYCTRANNTGASTSVNEPDGGIAYKSCTSYIVESKVTEVNGQMLKSTAPSFSGAALSILRIDEVTEF